MEKFKGKYTPGPWHVSIPSHIGKWAGFNTNQGLCYGVYATNDDLEAICIIPKDEMLVHSEQHHLANAHLIAAAPDLLEALQLLLLAYEDGGTTDFYNIDPVVKAKSAIQKALNQ